MTVSLGVLSSLLASPGFGDLLSVLIRVTLIAATGTLFCLLLHRASAAKRHLTAMATLIALIAFPAAKVFLPAVALPILPAHPTPSRTEAAAKVWPSGSPSTLASEPRVASAATEAGSIDRGASGMRPVGVAIVVYFVVYSALLLHILVSCIAAAVTARRARRIDDAETRRELRLARERLGVTRSVDIRESSDITVPVVWGLFRPVLLLPLEARDWSREKLRVVFLHEVAHVARHDGFGLLLARIATAVFWFHPLVWQLARVARRECERCCDDLVLASGERATDYAAHLLAIVRSMSRQDRFPDMAPAMAQRSNLEDRLASILKGGQRRDSVSRRLIVGAIGCATVLLAATTAVKVVAQTETPEQIREMVRKANRDARQQAREIEAAVMAAMEDGTNPKVVTPKHEGPCAEAISPQVLSIMPPPVVEAPVVEAPVVEAPEVSVAVAPVYSVAGGSVYRYKYKSHDHDGDHESGIEYMRDGQYSRAITAFEEEIRMTGSTNAMYNLACAHALKGDKKKAFDALQKAIENGFDNTHHMAEDEDLRSLQGDPHFYELVRLAKDLQLFGSGRFGDMDDEKDWQRVVPRLERVTREHPGIGRAWANLGFARLEAGDAKGGAVAYQKALDLGYEKPTTIYNLACCAARSGDIDGAFRLLDRADQAGFEIGQYVGSDSDLDALRGDPRYGAMLKKWDEKMAKEHRDEQSKKEKQRTD